MRRRSSASRSPSPAAARKSAGRSESAAATARAVAPIACSCESRRNASMREMNCTASHGSASSASAATNRRKRMPWMKSARNAAGSERNVDRERAEAARLALPVEFLRVGDEVDRYHAPLRPIREARGDAPDGAAMLELRSEPVVVAPDELVARDGALAHAHVGAPVAGRSPREGRRGREAKLGARERLVADAQLEARVRVGLLAAQHGAVMDLEEVGEEGLRANRRDVGIQCATQLRRH